MAPDPGQHSWQQQYSWQQIADSQCGVIAVRAVVAAGTSRSTIHRQVRTGRWQRPMAGVLVTRPQPLTRMQLLWCAVESIGPHAVVGGASAAAMGGLRGFDDEHVTIVVPAGRYPAPRPGVVIHHSARLDSDAVHPHLRPPRTRLARSVVDMAGWARRPEAVYDIIASAVRQRLVTVGELRAATGARGPIPRKNLILQVLGSLEAAQVLSGSGAASAGPEAVDQPAPVTTSRDDTPPGDGAPCHDGVLNSARSGAPSGGLMIPTHEYGRSALSSTGTPLASHRDRT